MCIRDRDEQRPGGEEPDRSRGGGLREAENGVFAQKDGLAEDERRRQVGRRGGQAAVEGQRLEEGIDHPPDGEGRAQYGDLSLIHI